MTGKCYYVTTLRDWRRHAARFAHSHWIACAAPVVSAGERLSSAGAKQIRDNAVGAQHGVPGADAWHRDAHSERPRDADTARAGSPAQQILAHDACNSPAGASAGCASVPNPGTQIHVAHFAQDDELSMCAPSVPDDATRILVLVEADEGVHLALEDDAAFEALPHPLSHKPISDAVQQALAQHGVLRGDTTFDAAEAVARVHPLLRHRVF